MFGRVPQSIIDDEESLLQTDHERSLELQNLRRVSDNAQKQYLKSRPAPSPESIKRVKEMDFSLLGIHPLFSEWQLSRCGRQSGGALASLPNQSLLLFI